MKYMPTGMGLPMRCVLVSMLRVLVVMVVALGIAQADERFSDAEKRLLPPYCQDKLAHRNEAMWRGRFGDGFAHTHHFCYGLIYANRVRLKGEKTFIKAALGEFEYVDKRWDQAFPLRTDMHVMRGELHAQAGDVANAISDYQKAIALNPNNWRPYAALSEFYRKQGDVQSARKVLEEGLEKSPESKMLKQYLEKLGA